MDMDTPYLMRNKLLCAVHSAIIPRGPSVCVTLGGLRLVSNVNDMLICREFLRCHSSYE